MLTCISAPRCAFPITRENGRSSKSFIAEGRWKAVLEQMKAGDYLLFSSDITTKRRPIHCVSRPHLESSSKTSSDMFMGPVSKREYPFWPRLLRAGSFARMGKPKTLMGLLRGSEASCGGGTGSAARYGEALPGIAVEDGAGAIQAIIRLGRAWEYEKRPDGLKDDTHFQRVRRQPHVRPGGP